MIRSLQFAASAYDAAKRYTAALSLGYGLVMEVTGDEAKRRCGVRFQARRQTSGSGRRATFLAAAATIATGEYASIPLPGRNGGQRRCFSRPPGLRPHYHQRTITRTCPRRRS
jgi:hypothetical protein